MSRMTVILFRLSGGGTRSWSIRSRIVHIVLEKKKRKQKLKIENWEINEKLPAPTHTLYWGLF